MKKTKKILLAILATLTAGFCALGVACGKTESSSSQSTGSEIVVLQGLEFYPLSDGTYGVTAGGNRGYLSEIAIPASITYKGTAYSVTSIGSYAFSGCSSLTSIEIPDSVTSIGEMAFKWCSSLTSVYITDIEAWCNISFGGFSANPLDYAKNLYLNNKLVTELEIPNTVTEVKAYAFYNCHSLTSVVIPDSVTSIGSGAFSGCSSLTSVVIPDSVTSIGSRAFSGCSSLTSITVDENNTAYKSIDGNLYSKDGKTLIQYAVGKTATTFTVPDTVTSIGEEAFSWCRSLTSVVIPDSVTSIGSGAFYNCHSLTSVVIPDSVTSIGFSVFEDCSSLTSIEIPDSVTSIGSGTFYNCSSLTSVVIPDSVTSIGSGAFSGCSSLTSVVIPDSVTSIGSSTFRDCDSLTIYCEAASQPSGWHSSWNARDYSYYCPVVWGYKGED